MLRSRRSPIGNPLLKSGFVFSGKSAMIYLLRCSILRGLKTLVEMLCLPRNRIRFHVGALIPSVEARDVTRIPGLAKPRSTQIPVWADFTRDGSQIMP